MITSFNDMILTDFVASSTHNLNFVSESKEININQYKITINNIDQLTFEARNEMQNFFDGLAALMNMYKSVELNDTWYYHTLNNINLDAFNFCPVLDITGHKLDYKIENEQNNDSSNIDANILNYNQPTSLDNFFCVIRPKGLNSLNEIANFFKKHNYCVVNLKIIKQLEKEKFDLILPNVLTKFAWGKIIYYELTSLHAIYIEVNGNKENFKKNQVNLGDLIIPIEFIKDFKFLYDGRKEEVVGTSSQL